MEEQSRLHRVTVVVMVVTEQAVRTMRDGGAVYLGGAEVRLLGHEPIVPC
jgi:hypothetical protein